MLHGRTGVILKVPGENASKKRSELDGVVYRFLRISIMMIPTAEITAKASKPGVLGF